MTEPTDRPYRLTRVRMTGERDNVERPIAVEEPVAFEFNGFGYAVIMATPADLADFAVGFALAERLIASVDQIREIETSSVDSGKRIAVWLSDECAEGLLQRVRHRIGESSCGLCGIENLEQAMRPLPRVTARCEATDAALFEAIDALRYHQSLTRATGGAHAAALCGPDGDIRLAREDVGRHTAFDKLIGAMRRQGLDWDGGFALLSSRCSYELVEKAALAGCPMLATLSAPTDLALRRARAAGLPLRVLARPDAFLEWDPE